VATGPLRWSRCNSPSTIPASDGPCELKLRLAEYESRWKQQATVCSRQRASAADFRRMPRVWAHYLNYVVALNVAEVRCRLSGEREDCCVTTLASACCTRWRPKQKQQRMAIVWTVIQRWTDLPKGAYVIETSCLNVRSHSEAVTTVEYSSKDLDCIWKMYYWII